MNTGDRSRSKYERAREEFLDELKRNQRLLAQWIAIARGGNHDILPEISSKLRVLLFDQSREIPLIFRVASLYKMIIFVYVQSRENPRKCTMESPIQKMKFTYHSNAFDWCEGQKEDRLTELNEELLQAEQINLNGESISLLDVLRSVCDKSGGAHFDPCLPSLDNRLLGKEIWLDGYPPMYYTVLRVAESVHKLLCHMIEYCDDGKVGQICVPEVPGTHQRKLFGDGNIEEV